jgi:hypothetical protein
MRQPTEWDILMRMKNDLPPWSAAAQALTPGRYRHFKGGEYEVLGVAHHSETFEELVVYRHADGSPSKLSGSETWEGKQGPPSFSDYGRAGLWVRPLAVWNEYVERDGFAGPRFARL